MHICVSTGASEALNPPLSLLAFVGDRAATQRAHEDLPGPECHSPAQQEEPRLQGQALVHRGRPRPRLPRRVGGLRGQGHEDLRDEGLRALRVGAQH